MLNQSTWFKIGEIQNHIYFFFLYTHSLQRLDYENRQWKYAIQIVYSYTWVAIRPPIFIPLYPILYQKHE